MRNTYSDPKMNIRMLDFEDVTTDSGITSMTAVEVAMADMQGNTEEKIDEILLMQ